MDIMICCCSSCFTQLASTVLSVLGEAQTQSGSSALFCPERSAVDALGIIGRRPAAHAQAVGRHLCARGQAQKELLAGTSAFTRALPRAQGA